MNLVKVYRAVLAATAITAMAPAVADEIQWETDVLDFGPVSVRYGFAPGFDVRNCEPIGVYPAGTQVGPPFVAYVIGKFIGGNTAPKRLRKEIKTIYPNGAVKTTTFPETILASGQSFCFFNGPYRQGELPSAGQYGWEFILNDDLIGKLNLQVQ